MARFDATLRLLGAAALLVGLSVAPESAIAQARRSAITGALDGLGRAMQDIGDEMAREAEERSRIEHLRKMRQLDEDIRIERQRRLQALENTARQDRAKQEAAQAAMQADEKKREQALISQLSPVSGTAFAIGRGLLVTNYHVISGYSVLILTDAEGKEHSAVPAIIDTANDIAILTSDGLVAQPLPIAVDSEIRKGARVYALGFPRPDIQGQEMKITEGIVNSMTGFQGETARLQMSAAVQPGNSGGPIVGSSGAVLGVVVSGLRQGQNVNYAIKPGVIFKTLMACECGAEKRVLKVLPRKTSLSPEELASRADRSVFRISALPSSLTADRLSRRDFGTLSAEELKLSGEIIKKYHPRYVSTIRSDEFKAWLSKQQGSVLEDYETAEYPEIAIRVIDRFYSATRPHLMIR